MVLNHTYINNDQLDSDLYFLSTNDLILNVDTYTDLLILSESALDIIQELSSVDIGSLYIQSVVDTGIDVDSYTDNLVTTISDIILEVGSTIEVYFPAPGNELDFIVCVDTYSSIAAFIESVVDVISSTDSYVDTVILIDIDEDTIIELSSYTSIGSFVESLVDVIRLVDVIDTFEEADSFTVVDSYKANTYVSNVNLIPISNLLPDKFINIPLFSDFLSVFNTLVVDNFHSTIDDFITLRTPTELDIFYAEKLSNSMGFYQDITNKSDSQKRRLLESLVEYYSRNGTKFTFNFLSFIADESLSILPLFTQDYLTFSTTPLGTLEPTGSWYLTNVVDLEYSSNDVLDNNDIITRFYQVAPVPLVLRNISRSEVFIFTEYNQGYVHVSIELITTNGNPI